jgi:DNA-binding NarL/FixJ family response regulator
MQAQLLTGALRRRPEFRVNHRLMDAASILDAVTSKLAGVALLSMRSATGIAETITRLRRCHLALPDVAKVLLRDSCDRQLVVSAFRSGARGIFAIPDCNLRLLCKCWMRVTPDKSGLLPSNRTVSWIWSPKSPR